MPYLHPDIDDEDSLTATQFKRQQHDTLANVLRAGLNMEHIYNMVQEGGV